MSTITREWLQQAINDYESVRDELPFGLDDYQGNILSALRIALASLEAEPMAVNDDMAYAFHHALSDSSLGADEVEEIKTGLRASFANVTTQPAPVVPDDWQLVPKKITLEMEYALSKADSYEIGWLWALAAAPKYEVQNAKRVQNALNSCRAAMLHGAEPVNQTYKSPQTQFKQVADLYEMQFDDGRTCTFHTDAQKAVQWLQACDGNRVQEYVKLERLQNALSGNYPATPDGWVMVPKELTPEMMRAVQIRSELGGYATSNLSGAYNMFSEFWNVAVSAAPKVDDL